MKYVLEVNLDNAAFDPDPGIELARILREAADRAEGYDFLHERTRFPLRDINGNKVGEHGYDGGPRQ